MEEQITIVAEAKSHEKTRRGRRQLRFRRERRGTFEACRIESEVEKAARSAEKARVSETESAEVETGESQSVHVGGGVTWIDSKEPLLLRMKARSP